MVSLSESLVANFPPPNEFDFCKPESWRLWKKRFLRYGRLTLPSIVSDRDRIDMLFYTMGEKSESIIDQIMTHVDMTFEEVLQALTDYFALTKNSTLERYRFNSRIQLPDESVDQFITVLHILAESCHYGTMKDELIRDRIVAGLSDTRTLEKLQLESCLTLENTITIARQAEVQQGQHDQVFQDSSSVAEIDLAAESNTDEHSLSSNSFNSKPQDQESCKYSGCEGTRDLEMLNKSKSVSCTKNKHDQNSSSAAGIDLAAENNTGEHSSGSNSFNSKPQDQESCKYSGCEEPGDLEIMDKSKSVSCSKTEHGRDSQDSSSAVEVDCASENNADKHFSGSNSFNSEPEDQESCKYSGCEETGGSEMEDISRNVSNLKTMNQIQKKAETERLDTHPNNTPLNTPSKDNQNSNWKRSQNAWKPGRLLQVDIETEALYKRVRGVLNKLTPQKFDTLVNQVRALQIDSQERLQGVIDLVFEKAVKEPSFSVAYAFMCKELAMMHVSGPDSRAGKEESTVSFRKLIITRCQMEFEKNTVDENARAIKLKEIEACADPEKKKKLQHILTEDERRIRVKSVGNIRFIGELFKQGMLTTNIMHRCIRHLLTQIDDESLECLSELLSTIGKDLESKNQNLEPYFKQMLDIVSRKAQGKVSSRVRFMLQDVIELRLNKWIPRRDDSNPKTMDQIQKEAETERLDTHLNNTPSNTPRKDDRNSDRKRNRVTTEEGGWSQPVRSRTQYSVETSKLKNKPPPMDNLQLSNKNMFQWSRNVSADAPKTVTPNKFAMLENMSSDPEKRSALPLSGSRSTGPRDYGRPDYKSSYDGRSSRNGSQQLSSRSSSRRRISI